MKSFKSTWLMSVFVLLLAGYTVYEYRNSASDQMVEKGERNLFDLKREDVNEIKLTARGKVTVLRKEAEAWKIFEPIQDVGETPVIDGFLFTMLGQKAKTFRTPEESKTTNWTEFGLDPAPLVVEISASGKSVKIEASDKPAFDGNTYLRIDGELLLGDRGLPQQIERDPNSFRSRQVWRESSDVRFGDISYDLDGKKENFKVILEGESAKLDPAPAFPVDPERIKSWIEALQGMVASDFVAEELSDTVKREFLLMKPSFVAKFRVFEKSGESRDWTLTMGQDKGEDVYFYTTSRPTLYKIDRKTLLSLRVSKDFFRDQKVPFQYPIEQATQVEVHSAKGSFSFRKDDSNWSLVNPESGKQLNQEKLVQMIQNLKNLEAQDVTKALAKGIPVKPQVQVKDAKGQMLLSVAWGDEYQSQAPQNKGMTFRFVKTNNSKSTFGVLREKLDTLIDEGIVENKAEAPKDKSSETK